MPLIPMDLMLVFERFPDRKAEIKRSFKENERFRAICRDYGICRQALRRWNRSGLEEAMERRIEYTALMDELETELLENLDEYKY